MCSSDLHCPGSCLSNPARSRSILMSLDMLFLLLLFGIRITFAFTFKCFCVQHLAFSCYWFLAPRTCILTFPPLSAPHPLESSPVWPLASGLDWSPSHRYPSRVTVHRSRGCQSYLPTIIDAQYQGSWQLAAITGTRVSDMLQPSVVRLSLASYIPSTILMMKIPN